MTGEIKSKSWWETVPGLITAIAAAITAVGGLIVALNQVGVFGDEQTTSTSDNNKSTGESELAAPAVPPRDKGAEVERSESKKPENTPNDQRISLSVPKKFTYKSLLFQILSAELDKYSDKNSKVAFRFRAINQGSGAYDLSPSGFRLLSNDVPYSPDNYFSEYISGDSSKELEVNFLVPSNSSGFQLRIGKKGDSNTRTIDVVIP